MIDNLPVLFKSPAPVTMVPQKIGWWRIDTGPLKIETHPGTGTRVWRTDGRTPDPVDPYRLRREKVNPADGFGSGRNQENTLLTNSTT